MGVPRLSLRARLLAALLAVTTVFLVVLGLVALVAVGKRLGADFDGQLTVDASHEVSQLVNQTDLYAVYYSRTSHRTGIISAPSQAGRELQAWLTQVTTGPHGHPPAQRLTPFTLNLGDGRFVLRAVWRLVGPKEEINQTVVPHGPVIIVVARKQSQRLAPLRQIVLAEVITGVILVALLAGFGPWLIRRGLAPLGRMANTADEITTRGDLTARMPDPGDRAEAGRLSAAINTMLDRIQHAFQARYESEQKVRQFAADASHELRTPIAVIQGYVNMLDRWGKSDEKVLEESIAAIQGESKHMQRLVEQLLFLARGDIGQTQLERETFDLTAMLQEVYDESLMIDEAHSYRLIQTEGPIEAVGDQGLLKQVARILIENAAKYSAPGGVISLKAGRDPNGSVYFQIQDEGQGMTAEDVPHIFERFYRADNSRTKSTGGTGLGLAIAKWIIDRHGGHFDVLSYDGLGTRIVVNLP